MRRRRRGKGFPLKRSEKRGTDSLKIRVDGLPLTVSKLDTGLPINVSTGKVGGAFYLHFCLKMPNGQY